MIKNVYQLKSAKELLEKIEAQIGEYRKIYFSTDADFYIKPLVIQRQHISEEIEEYTKLQELSFEEAISELLSTPILIDNISELLSKLRLASKLTQSELADRLGWEQSNLSRFENENYSSQTVSKIVEFAGALGVYLLVTPSLTEHPNDRFFNSLKQYPILNSQMQVSTAGGIIFGRRKDDYIEFYKGSKTGIFVEDVGKHLDDFLQFQYSPTGIGKSGIRIEDTGNEYHKAKNYADNLTTA